MTLTPSERLILATNLLILERLGPPANGADPVIDYGKLREAREALQYGFEFELEDLSLPLELYEETFSTEACQAVRDILRMFDTLKGAYDQSANKGGVTEDELRFPGWDYDGTEAQEWEYAKYLVETRALYNRVVGGGNARTITPQMGKYRAMLAVFDGLPQHDITIEGIKQVLAAGR